MGRSGVAERASRYIDHLSILLSKANPYEVPSCNSVARYSERNLDHPHFPSHHRHRTKKQRDKDQEDESTLRPRTYIENGHCGLGSLGLEACKLVSM